MEHDGDICSKWYVMRDLKRSNALERAIDVLRRDGLEVFTPVTSAVVKRAGVAKRVARPIIPDLLFVRADKSLLDKYVALTPTLQYRYVKGAPYQTPMVVEDRQMQVFIDFSNSNAEVKYYTSDEITPDMIGRRISIVGGEFAGLEGNLMSVRGSRKKRLVISLEGVMAASVVVQNEFIKFEN